MIYFLKKFFLRINCQSVKYVIEKDINIVSKQNFIKQQAIFSNFDFEIEFIKGDINSFQGIFTDSG